MNKYSWTGIILAASFLATVFSGCGTVQESSGADAVPETSVVLEEAETEEPEAAPQASSEEPETEQTEEPSAVEPEEEVIESAIQFPLEETETLTYWHDFDTSYLAYVPSGQMEDLPGFQAAKEATNVEIRHVTAPSGMEADQFNLMCASGDLTDMIKNATTLYSKGAVGALDDEIIMDLRPLIDDYAPHFVQALGLVDNYIKDVSTDDSRIPTFVSVYVNGLDYSQGLWVRKDIFDAAGIEIPEIYNEFTDALRALKAYGVQEPLYMDPNGVFAKNLMAGGYDVAVSMLFGMGAAATEPFYQVDGTVTFGALEPGWLEYVSMVRSWYEEELISHDFPSNAAMPLDPAFLSNITTGQTAVFVAPVMLMDYIVSSGVDYDPNFRLQAVAEPVREPGATSHFGQENQTSMTNGTCISTACRNPELAAAWCDYWYTEEGRMLATWGTEGLTYVLDDQGEPRWTDLITHNPDGMSKMSATSLYCLEVGTIRYEDTDTSGFEPYLIEAMEIWKSGRDNSYDIPSTASFTSEESARYNELMGDISTYYQETLLRFLTGDMDLAEYDSFVSTLKTMGIDECISIKQAVLDRYLAR